MYPAICLRNDSGLMMHTYLSEYNDRTMTKGVCLSLLLHVALVSAGLLTYSTLKSQPVKNLNFISVEIVSDVSSAPEVDIIQEELSLKKLSPEEAAPAVEEKKEEPEARVKPLEKISFKEKPLNLKPKQEKVKPVSEASSTSGKSESRSDKVADEAGNNSHEHGNSSYNGAARVGPVAALYEQTIISKLERVKRYPSAALMRRLEGEVLLYLEIAANGQVQESEIRNSSGYKLFDSEVLSMVKRAGSFPKLQNAPETLKLTYLIPITFRIAST